MCTHVLALISFEVQITNLNRFQMRIYEFFVEIISRGKEVRKRGREIPCNPGKVSD